VSGPASRTRPPRLPGYVTTTEPCPTCGAPWHIGIEDAYADALSPTGLTFDGDVAVAVLRNHLGACDTCREEAL
jgi:hypothetical protein